MDLEATRREVEEALQGCSNFGKSTQEGSARDERYDMLVSHDAFVCFLNCCFVSFVDFDIHVSRWFDILVCSAKGRDGYIGSRGKMSFDLNKRDTALKSDDSRCFFFSVFF